jgi:hypothetical protein
MARSATASGISPSARWFGVSSCSNHQRLSRVSSAPFSGMPGDSAKSNALTRSLATTRMRVSAGSSEAYRSRTLPE